MRILKLLMLLKFLVVSIALLVILFLKFVLNESRWLKISVVIDKESTHTNIIVADCDVTSRFMAIIGFLNIYFFSNQTTS